MGVSEDRTRAAEALARLHAPHEEKRVVIATEMVEACALLSRTGQALLASHRKTSLPRRIRALLTEVSEFLLETTGKGLSLPRSRGGVDTDHT